MTMATRTRWPLWPSMRRSLAVSLALGLSRYVWDRHHIDEGMGYSQELLLSKLSTCFSSQCCFVETKSLQTCELEDWRMQQGLTRTLRSLSVVLAGTCQQRYHITGIKWDSGLSQNSFTFFSSVLRLDRMSTIKINCFRWWLIGHECLERRRQEEYSCFVHSNVYIINLATLIISAPWSTYDVRGHPFLLEGERSNLQHTPPFL